MAWTREDHIAANAEGWDLFDTDEGVRLQRIDEPELWAEDNDVVIARVWDDDDDAMAFVTNNPSDLHTKALDMIGDI